MLQISTISKACRTNSLPEIRSLLETAHHQTPADYPEILNNVLRKSLYYKCSPDIIEYLVGSEKAPVDKLSVTYVARSASIPVLDILITHGWNVNCADSSSGWTLIYHVIHDDATVQWLVDHGADVGIGDFEYLANSRFEPRPAPLLEHCACCGSLASFQFLREKGARLSRRTLHGAAQNAAAAGVDPAIIEPSKRPGEEDEDFVHRREAGRILRYLVDELKLDVNEMDCEVRGQMPPQMHWGTPVNYAARERAGAAVVRWLLDKGADLTIGILECEPDAGVYRYDAEDSAKASGSEEIVELIRKWKCERITT